MSIPGDPADGQNIGDWSPPYQPPVVPQPVGPAPVRTLEGKSRRSSRRLLRTAGLLVVVGMILSAPSMAMGWSAVSELTSLERHDVPGSFVVDVTEPGNYAVYLRTGVQQQTGIVTTSSSVFVETIDISVTGPAGNDVATQPAYGFYLQLDSEQFTAAHSFDVEATGAYRVALETDPATVALVSKSIEFPPIPLILLGILSGLLVSAGLVTALIGFFRRRDERSRSTPTFS